MSNFCNGIYILDITDVNGCQGYVKPSIPPPFVANIGSDVEVVIPGVSPAIPTTSCFNLADAMVGFIILIRCLIILGSLTMVEHLQR